MRFEFQIEEEIAVEEVVDDEDLRDLVVYNDDINTFEHVTATLIKICKHDPEQAEQCTYIIHFKGKCAVKKGTYKELKPMREGVCDAGIKAAIV
ncbi:MAG: ATP-dependent Clp protease adaptor ClpS [Bacteroidota bacterium]